MKTRLLSVHCSIQVLAARRFLPAIAIVLGVCLALPANVQAIEDPVGCSVANGGLGNARQGGINFNLAKAHVGDTVPVFASLGMVAGACKAINVTCSIWIATGRLTNFLANVTLDPGVLNSCPSSPQCQPGPYNILITPQLVGAGVNSPNGSIGGAAKSVRAVENGEGTVLSGVVNEPLVDFHSATIAICTPCIQVVKLCAYPPGTTCFPAGAPIQFTGYVTNCGDIRLTNVTVLDDRTASLMATNGQPLFQPLTLDPGQAVGFQGSFTPTAAETCAGSAANTVTVRGTDITPIGGSNASVTNQTTVSCNLCVVALQPTLTCPANITTNILGNNVTVNYPNPTVANGALQSCTPPSGSLFPLGTTLVNCTATNACATNACTFNVTVQQISTNCLCFAGLEHCPLGAATLNINSNKLLVGNLGSSGNDGVSIVLNQTRGFLEVFWQNLNPTGSVPDGAFVRLTAIGTVEGQTNQVVGFVEARDIGSTVQIFADYSGIGSTSQTIEVRDGGPQGVLVARVTGHTGPVAERIHWPFSGHVGALPTGGIAIDFDWLGFRSSIAVIGGPTVVGDYLCIVPEFSTSVVDAVSRVTIMAKDIPLITITDEVVPAAALLDDFESYAVGSNLHGQGGWAGWAGNPGAGALVSSAFSLSPTRSVNITGASDLVHTVSCATSGPWVFSVRQYIPSTSTGTTFVVLMNTYRAPYGAADLKWSVQIQCNLATGQIISDLGGAATRPMVKNQWVELRCEINLAANSVSEYYNGQLLSTHAWQGGTGGPGLNEIQALDLFANNAGPVYYDNVNLVALAPPVITQQPQSQTVSVGGNAVFSVTATGTPPLIYQWLFNSAPIGGASSSSLVISNVMAASAGSYAVIVSNQVGTVRSAEAILALAPAEPPLIQCPGDISVQWNGSNGMPVVFTVTATDNCHSNLPVTCMPASGSLFSPGATLVVCTATDPNGLSSHCSFLVNVVDAHIGIAQPVLVNTSYGAAGFSVSFQTQAGVDYVVEYKTSLAALAWTVLRTVPGTGGIVTVTDTAGGPMRFYRVRAQPAVGTGSLFTIFEPPEAPHGQPSACRGEAREEVGPPFVHLYSGEFHYEMEDLRIPGRGLDFIWSRRYRSRAWPDSAQGNNWDFSYNIRAERNGSNMDVLDGHARRDTYFLQPDGTYAAPQFFREGRISGGNVFTLTFADAGTWEFLPLDGSAAQGKLSRSTDRNGNSLSFFYDVAGRLVRVRDTLSRDILIAYNTDGYIATVTDFIGRQMNYSYYMPSDPDGGAGDLKSATSPAVVGTPNGNDFPAGKTVTYTYSKGFADDRLNHNLLTITDARGKTWLRNTYAAALNPADFSFDRLVQQAHGSATDVLEFHYVPQAPTAQNAYALVKAIVSDRVGNVSEVTSDFYNRPILRRAFTGRAVPNQPVTEVLNRPTGQLRATDPAYFDTRYEWNGDSSLVRLIEANGNTTENVYEQVLNPNVGRRARGNVRIRRERAGPLGGDQSVREEFFDYDSTLGGGACCFNFVTKHTDARGNITRHTYDAFGNRIHTVRRLPNIVEDWEYNAFGQMTAHIHPDNGTGSRRRDEFTFYTTGPETGYARQQIVDATGFALTTTLEYDAVGNVVRRIDPRGFDTLYTVNALNQTVRQASAMALPAVRYLRDTSFDANNNVVRLDTENRDALGALQANTHFTETRDYGFLNELLRVTREVDPVNNVVEEYAYDANRNRTLVRRGEATAGRDPFNIARTFYDERNMVYRETRGEGGATPSTTQHSYDGNGNVKSVHEGLEGASRVTRIEHNGFDEPRAIIDPMVNTRRFTYDPNGNVVTERHDGELVDGPECRNPVRMLEHTDEYDAEDRLTVMREAFFHALTQAPLRSGQSVFRIDYAASGRETNNIDENGHPTVSAFDTANRLRFTTDAKGNTSTNIYDANNNVIVVIEVDRCDLGSLDQVFATTNAYDALNRLVQTVDNAGNTTRHSYDSRHNRTLTVDARGNRIVFEYDGLNRLIRTTRQMTDTGDGSGNPAGTIVTAQTWDDSSRLTTQTDPDGNVTRYGYDSLDRRVSTTFADGTTQTASYDVHGNPVTTTDANGTVVFNMYDLLSRLMGRTILRAPGVGGTTYETYQYDGLSRVIRAENNESIVAREYDSLGHIVRETQQVQPGGPVRVLQHEFDEADNLVSSIYPGGRVITRTYDQLHRVKTIVDGAGALASYDYLGAKRVQRRDYFNGTRYTPSYDSIRRFSSVQHTRLGGATFDNRSFTWDRMNNKTNVTDLRPSPQNSRAVAYDSANRMIRSLSLSGRPTIDYALDSAGNRISVTGGTEAGPYFLSSGTPEPADAQMNQYTDSPLGGRSYDRNGNLTANDARTYRYDYRNQMIETAPGPVPPSTYRYDAFGRRVEKNVAGQISRYNYDGDAEVEEQDITGTNVTTLVWGATKGELAEMRRGALRYFYHADELDSVMEVTDANGAVVEQYTYGDYGQPEIYNGAGEPLSQSAIQNPWLFTGHRYDAETGFYYCKTRYLDPRAGRFTTRDTIGIWGDPAALGNGFTYAGNNPFSFIDQDGRKTKAQRKEARAARQERREKRREAGKAWWQITGKVVLSAVKAPFFVIRAATVLTKGLFTWTNPFKIVKAAPFYGNYCGRVKEGFVYGSVAPIDELDKCCFAHDNCATATSIYASFTAAEQECNKQIAICARSVVCKDTYPNYLSKEARECRAARADIRRIFGDREY